MVDIQELIEDQAQEFGADEIGGCLFKSGSFFDRVAWLAFEETAFKIGRNNNVEF